MNEPVFLTVDEVIQIHNHQIATYGGDDGVREVSLVESAIAQPRQRFDGAFLHPDIASMAAAYFFHLIANHGFVDGNKRTGVHASVVFLALNGLEVEWDQDEVESLAMGVANSQTTKDDVIRFFTRLLTD